MSSLIVRYLHIALHRHHGFTERIWKKSPCNRMTHLNLLPSIIDLKANILATNNFDGQWSIKIWPRAPFLQDSLLFNPTVKGAGSRISPWITNEVSGAFKYLNRLSDLCRKIALHNPSYTSKRSCLFLAGLTGNYWYLYCLFFTNAINQFEVNNYFWP